MTVYVDDLLTYPNRPHGHEQWCHMACDGDIGELHQMARAIGLKRQWFQDGRMEHYDVTPTKRQWAISLGAVAVSGTELARRCWMPFLENGVREHGGD